MESHLKQEMVGREYQRDMQRRVENAMLIAEAHRNPQGITDWTTYLSSRLLQLWQKVLASFHMTPKAMHKQSSKHQRTYA